MARPGAGRLRVQRPHPAAEVGSVAASTALRGRRWRGTTRERAVGSSPCDEV